MMITLSSEHPDGCQEGENINSGSVWARRAQGGSGLALLLEQSRGGYAPLCGTIQGVGQSAQSAPERTNKYFAVIGNVKRAWLAASYAGRMDYRLCRLDGITQHIISAEAVFARDDLDALQEAERLCETHAIEVWQGTRCVARVKKGNAPLSSLDRLSL